MIPFKHCIPILTVLVLLVAACGSGTSGTASAAPASSAAAAGESQAVASEAPAAGAPSEAAPTTAPVTGGGAAADVCALVTPDELGGILGKPVKSAVIAGPPDTCDIQSTDGAPLAAFVLTKMGGVAASAVYNAYASAPGASTIAGIGEQAAYDPSQGTLLILKNGAVLSVAVFDDGSGSPDAAARLELMKKIGSIAAGRM